MYKYVTGCRMLDAGCPVPGAGCWVPGLKCAQIQAEKPTRVCGMPLALE